MEQFQINSPEDFQNMLNTQKEEILEVANVEAQRVAREIVESEFELFEFKLFISSFGKKEIDKATKEVAELRKKVNAGKIDLSKYDEMGEEF